MAFSDLGFKLSGFKGLGFRVQGLGPKDLSSHNRHCLNSTLKFHSVVKAFSP